MREVNFSIPNANKAAVSITTALYDRRALDCTSTLPLINSLNNLAYLTTSSGRIRDILTVDGGIERLVCILKEGRSKDMMEMWKWNLAFQCIVNIGVRGTEAVRTRVVEADMVPVIATILDNYWQVIEKCRERVETENRRKCPLTFGSSRSSRQSSRVEQRSERQRRHLPPPISIPENSNQADDDEHNSDVTPTGPVASISLSSPPERTTFPRLRDTRQQGQRGPFPSPTLASSRQHTDPPLTANPLQSSTGLRPVRDVDRLPSMGPLLHSNVDSHPLSPTTPGAPGAASGSRPRRRPSIRHQLSMSGSDDDGQMDESQSEDSGDVPGQQEPVVGIQADIEMRDIVDDDGLLESNTDGVTLAVQDVSSADDETFNITHRASADGSQVNLAATPTQAQAFPAQPPTPGNTLNPTPPTNLQQTPAWYQARNFAADRPTPATVLAAMPRDEDVLMSLQLLAFVSKYCNLRSYFQKSHLVPRLKIGNDLRLLDPEHNPTSHPGKTQEELDDEWDNEFVQKPEEKAYNIFPLIEKFTSKPSSRHGHANPNSPQQSDMQYWAGVVMRNLCRKDEKRGIRQCAYWQCGKWEEYQRQFAKCRRCRRTKYCSKECQKGAWGSHRFWCIAADPRDENRDGGSGEGRHRHHHRSSHHHSHSSSHHHGSGSSTTQQQQSGSSVTMRDAAAATTAGSAPSPSHG
ncbi:hypothetical protein K431DRAFT_231631 [Polychaeton citri CBS 116435]|uniref:MYND-type zinc finger protein samB n=1 Tax=Polychaeton citri CBS 116435 TaxID=1314669 RepID=A0A9P4Q4Y4_9PEZI|nr:hypothetical protein K431DRAFT_231631 [Polychaeton citri CBS 116435]